MLQLEGKEDDKKLFVLFICKVGLVAVQTREYGTWENVVYLVGFLAMVVDMTLLDPLPVLLF